MWVRREKAKRRRQFVRVLTFKPTQQYQAGSGTLVPVASTSKCMQSLWNNCLFSTQVSLLMPAYLTQIHVISGHREPHFVPVLVVTSHRNPIYVSVLCTLRCFVVNCLHPVMSYRRACPPTPPSLLLLRLPPPPGLCLFQLGCASPDMSLCASSDTSQLLRHRLYH